MLHCHVTMPHLPRRSPRFFPTAPTTWLWNHLCQSSDLLWPPSGNRFTKSDLKRQTWMLSYVSICQLCQFTKKRSQWNGFVWKKRNWGNWWKLPSLGRTSFSQRGHGALLWPAALADSAPAFGTPIWSDGSAPVTNSLDSQSCYRDVVTLILIDWCIRRGVSKNHVKPTSLPVIHGNSYLQIVINYLFTLFSDILRSLFLIGKSTINGHVQ